MPYLNLDLNYGQHPKTRRLMAILGDTADVYPIRLWSYCGKIHPKDGAMSGYSRVEVEAVLGWKGRKGALVAAMLKVGFIVRLGGFVCVDWAQHQGHLDAFSRRGVDANKIRWDKVRAGIPVGVQKAKSGTPPTDRTVRPSLPSLPTEPTTNDDDQLIDRKAELTAAIKDLAGKKSRAGKEDRLLALVWKFGDNNGRKVQDLEPDYCRWAISNLSNIGQEYKDALAVRLEQKTSEAIK